MINLKVPGKLFLAGEFSATYSGQPSIIMAVDRFMDFKIESADKIEINSDLLGKYVILNNGFHNILDTKIHNTNWELIESTLMTFEKFRLASDNSVNLKPFKLDIKSYLNINNQKIGLGSSGATVVGLLAILLEFHQIPFSKIILFKLSTLTLLRLPDFKNGSMGDVAAAIFGGIVYYTKFDLYWVQNMSKKMSLSTLVNIDWPKLSLKNITLSSTWHLLVGWTQKPANTQYSLNKIYQQQPDKYFLSASANNVKSIYQAILENNWNLFKVKIAENQQQIIEYTNKQKIPYQTVDLKNFLISLKKFDLPGKISGAGNGDNGIAFQLDNKCNVELLNIWEKYHIYPLSLNIAPEKGISYGI